MASNAFKAATLTPLALAMVACKTETEQGEVIEVQSVSFDEIELKDGNTIYVKDIMKKISVTLSIDGKQQFISLENLYNEYKDKETFDITIANNGNTIYTIKNNDELPIKGYTFEKGENNFKISGKVGKENVSWTQLILIEEQGKDPVVKPEPGKDPNEKPDDPKPPVTSTETLTKQFESLKELFEYAGKTISEGDQQTGTITLTAQTIKKLAALPSVLEIEVPNVPTDTTEEEKEAKRKAAALAEYEKYKDLSTLVNAYDKKEIVVEKGEDVTLPTYRYDGSFKEDTQVPQYVISSDKAVALKDNFYYIDMALDISNLTNVNVDNATFSMGEDNSNYKVYVDMIESLYKDLNPNVTLDSDEILRSNENNNFNDYKTPKLDFNLIDIAYYTDELKKLTSLYKIYDKKDKLNNIQVSLKQNGTMVFNGKKEKEETILFDKDNNLNPNVPNVSVNVLSKLAELGGTDSHRRLENLVITGNYTKEEKEVDIKSSLVNVVFTGDVSGLKNSEENQFNGVVYFMDKPYNNIDGDSLGPVINGVLKLDKLEGVSYDTFRVNMGVLDLRGRDGFKHNPLEGYNIENKYEKGITHNGHNAIYFTEKYVDNIDGIDSKSLSFEKKFETLARRVERVNDGGTPLRNVYVDNTKYDSIAKKLAVGLYPEDHAVSKTPRSLAEFEYYGNALDERFEGGKFKTPARDSYADDDLESLNTTIKEKLEEDAKGNNQIVLNNRKIDFIDPETKKIIFSVLNDRQYNA